MRTLVVIFVAVLSANLFGQTADANLFSVKGEIRDKQDRVIPGLRLEFRDHETRFSGTTDINGRFLVRVSKGDYEVTADAIPTVDFRLFLKITDGPLNPDFLELTVNPANACSDWLKKSPKLQIASAPTYPPAAKAVRAFGDVSVKVTIDHTGKVLTAESVSGHPLLRAVSRGAAERSSFEPADASQTRSAVLTYTFLDPETEKPELKRMTVPCKIVINSPPIVLGY